MKTKHDAALTAAKDSLAPAVYNAITPFIASNPALAASLGLVAAALGGVVIYRQERFNSVVKDMIENPAIFTNKVLSSQDFQDGLVVHLDTVFKLRGNAKLSYARSIFFDFASSKNMPQYPLERYDDTLSKISDAAIRFLGFINTGISGIKEGYLSSKMHQKNNPKDPLSIKKFREIYVANEPLSTFVNLYVDKEVRKQAALSPRHEATPLVVEEEIRKSMMSDLDLVISELEQLGIMSRFSHQSLGWDPTTISGYNLTHYGRMFVSVIKPT